MDSYKVTERTLYEKNYGRERTVGDICLLVKDVRYSMCGTVKSYEKNVV